MKNAMGLFLLVVFLLPLACSMEKTEEDWAWDLYDKRHRDRAMLYIQEHADNPKLVKEALPVLEYLVTKRYGTLKAVFTMGVLKDPVAVPFLLKQLKDVSTKDSEEHDRLTEQICMSLGMIGDKTAVGELIEVVKSDVTGEMGKAGGIQALGAIGDRQAIAPLRAILKDKDQKIQLRHYATISLGKLNASEAADDLAYALFVDDGTGLNLFRDGQTALLRIGGKEMRDALIKLYNFQNKDIYAIVDKEGEENVKEIIGLAKEIGMKPGWVKIKAVEVMGQSRDPELVPFLLEQFKLGADPKADFDFEVFAKVAQSLGRLASPAAMEEMYKLFIVKPPKTEFLNEKEFIAQALMQIGLPQDKLETLMEIVEGGEQTLISPVDGKPTLFPQWPMAAANLLSMLDIEGQFEERFAKVVEEKKINSTVFGLAISTPELMEAFHLRLKMAKECKKNAQCYYNKLKALHTHVNAANESKEQKAKYGKYDWAIAERALYSLAHLNAKNLNDALEIGMKYIGAKTFETDRVRDAVVFAANKLATKEIVPKLAELQQKTKLDRIAQKASENLGYVLILKRREFNIKSDAIFEE